MLMMCMLTPVIVIVIVIVIVVRVMVALFVPLALVGLAIAIRSCAGFVCCFSLVFLYSFVSCSATFFVRQASEQK